MISAIRHITRTLSSSERIVFAVVFVVFVLSGIFLSIHAISTITVIHPAYGGTYTEGIVGQPSFINPVLAKNGTPDKDLVMLLFANIPTLAESIKHDKDFRIWTIRIKEGAQWHDGTPITSDDIIFTIQTIQNPDTLSPLFSDWQHISVTRTSEREIRFELLSSYSLFETLLAELRPIPKKLFADLSPANFRLSLYNLEPIGSGPYYYTQLEKRKDGFIEGYRFGNFDAYERIASLPYIDTIKIKFYENDQKLLQAYNIGVISGFHTPLHDNLDNIRLNSRIIEIPTTKYFALFLNENANPLLASATIRQALSYATNKERIIKDVFDGTAITTNGPIPPTMPSYSKEISQYWEYDRSLAEEFLAEQGWEKNPETGLLEISDGNEAIRLAITIASPNIPQLEHIARLIVQDWQAIGIDATLNLIDPTIINEKAIKTRNYDALMFGNILSSQPDLFSFWHSSERFYPGLNLALYQDDTVDEIIQEIRTLAVDSEERAELLDILQAIIAQDIPAIFLVSPKHFYVTKQTIPGITIDRITLPNDRFNNITDWFIKTRRSFR